jgi:hypothetical protein
MLEFVTKLSSVTYRWTFSRMLATLPGPGTEGFGLLSRELNPFGIKAAKVVLEQPSNRLGDIGWNISLIDDRVAVRIFYEAFEVIIDFIDSIHEIEDSEALKKIAETVIKASKKIDADADKGQAKIWWRAHVELQGQDVDQFLAEHLPRSNVDKRLIPEAFSYKFKWVDLVAIQEPRIIIARSLLFPQSVYIDFYSEYGEPAEPSRHTSQFNKDALRAIEELGLHPKQALMEGRENERI